jgi:hypothetical protein
MSTHTAHDSAKYYVPHSSPWPIYGSIGLFTLMLGAVSFMNEWASGWAQKEMEKKTKNGVNGYLIKN